MNATDLWGNAVSGASPATVRGLEAATLKLHAYQADPVADIDAVIAEQPDCPMPHAFRAGVLATALDKAFEGEMLRSLEAAEALAPRANDRERGHIAALRLWADGDYSGATEAWGRTAIAHPRDGLAVQFAHIGDFALGYSHMLRDRIARVLPYWRGAPGQGFMLGMHAFGLEESGDYAAAEEVGRKALTLDRQDGWAAHAVAHVMEMTGRAAEGVAFIRATAPDWAPGSMFAYHNWWHLALFHLDRGDAAEALRLFDEDIAGGNFGQALELVDGSALLWRLHALGHPVGDRWHRLADGWKARIADGAYAFNDLHAMMAFVGLGDAAAQRELIANVRRSAEGAGTNAMMAREVGLPACLGFAAFGQGDYAEAVAQLLPIRGKANRFGGSHAQRDVFSWTLTEAALRLGDKPLAEAMATERLAAKPDSPLNLAWARRGAALEAKRAA
ncbi:tetratricopeptide repeat protein [Craurococcus roseus]|uniref:Tetratricopeptide repeat protein 38 n=1 Tax=Craurococcus roseus TaxID=77585 RepID=A0ABP3RIZ2_9PROT